MSHSHSAPRQRVVLVASVLLLHVLALWALQAGLLQSLIAPQPEVVIPVEAVTEQAPPPPPPPHIKQAPPEKAPEAPRPQPAPTPVSAQPTPAPAPLPQATADPAPSPNAPVGTLSPPTAAATPAPVAAPPATPKVELPSSTADYLHNPKPKYPRLSKNRNEQGKVLLSVLVGADGKPREVSVLSSSGFELLDRAAREAVLGWTFVPGKRNGVPVDMQVEVPIAFQSVD